MKTMAYGILTVMITGLLGNALALWRDSAVMNTRVETVEKKQEKQDNDYNELSKQVYELHWHLIKSQKVVVPPKDK
jgi:hypothetical protein